MSACFLCPKTFGQRRKRQGKGVCGKELLVLKVYLRDYISQTHPAKKPLSQFLKYWGCVVADSRSVEDPLDNVALQVGWSRTKLDISSSEELTEVTVKILSHFRGLLRLRQNSSLAFTDQSFAYFTNLRSLDMEACCQTSITDDAFRFLLNLRSLNMNLCSQTTITDDAFAHLVNLKCLHMEVCRQTTITNEAFRHLRNLTALNLAFCKQTTISDEAFHHLGKLRYLDISYCNQTTITDNAFGYLMNLNTLHAVECNQKTLTHEAFSHLEKLTYLNADDCSPTLLTNECVKNLTNLKLLRVTEQSMITSEVFDHFTGLILMPEMFKSWW